MKTILRSFILAVFLPLQLFAQYNIGKTTITLRDASRSRNIITNIFYPATTSGTDAAIVNDGTKFPVISFGHGFVMSSLAYQWLSNALVPKGYILAFPATEEGVPPLHSEFGKDEVFVARTVRSLGDSINSIFFGKTSPYAAVGGHSMGGGASFLGMQNVTDITTFFNFAAAETFLTESAIQTAKKCTQPALVFAGKNDCVAPAGGNSRLMYGNLASEYKIFANLDKGSHCGFGDPNVTPCELGELLACAGTSYIPEATQKARVLQLLEPWMDFWLKRNCDGITRFYDNIAANSTVWDTLQSKAITCAALGTPTAIRQNNAIKAQLFPNPVSEQLLLQLDAPYQQAEMQIADVQGKIIYTAQWKGQQQIQVSVADWPAGLYLLRFTTEKGDFISRFQKL